jgi:hypothetical protein
LANAVAQRAVIRAKIAADNARFKGGPGNADELAKTASQIDRPAVVRAAEEQIALAEKEVLDARRKFEADNRVIGPLKRAEETLSKAKKALQAGQAALTDLDSFYTPLSPVYPAKSTGRRKALAEWIASRQNPLTARVAMNHIWMRHFGKPIVESTSDFGRNGKKPTHPELLDWLAVELMENRWSMKAIHRLIVTSGAYRMASRTGEADELNLSIDRDNHYLWRFNPVRMQAEVVRDAMLAAAGELDRTLGGPDIDTSLALKSRRRTLYLTQHPETKVEFLDLFDAPSTCDCYKRTETILPQQALAMTNSELALDQSRLLARRLSTQAEGNKTEAEARQRAFVDAAFEQILSRGPTDKEREASRRFFERQRQLFRAADPNGLAGKEGEKSGAPSAAGVHVSASADPELRACESFVRSLFSHNEFVTVY